MIPYIFKKGINPLPGDAIGLVPKPEPEIIEGLGARKYLGTICRSAGYKSCLLVTDKTIFSLGYHNAIVSSLAANGILCSVFCDINSEPTVNIIEAGRKAALDCSAECIIALGGGSVLDSSKMIAAAVCLNSLSVKHLLLKFLFIPQKTLPLITVPSTSGTGAEITVGAVITDTEKNTKNSTVLVGLNITNVILDSELTLNAPAAITAACGIDALSHGLEGILSSARSSDDDITKSMECVRLVLENLGGLMSTPDNSNARLLMCRAALYGGNAINTQLAGYIHAFAHSLGAMYHIPHGKAIALSLLPILKFSENDCLERLHKLSVYCGTADAGDPPESASDKLISAIEKLIGDCGLLDISGFILPEHRETLAAHIAEDAVNYSVSRVLKKSEILYLLDEINRQIQGVNNEIH